MNDQDLARELRRLDGRPYPAYKDLRGRWHFDAFDLVIDHVQGDPFAAPSRLSVHIPLDIAGLPLALVASRARRIGAQDALLRCFEDALRGVGSRGGRRGSGKSGELRVDGPGQAMLERSGCQIREGVITLRFTAGLPAGGRRILGRQAMAMLCEDIPQAVAASLMGEGLDVHRVRAHALAYEDQEALRGQLAERGLLAFVAEGSVLPRRSGADDRPMSGGDVVPWAGPDSMRVSLEAPNAGEVIGTGIPQGVTLICGGGYHGKSTLLSALSVGVYNHIPGDGREGVICDDGAVSIRAEDGRRVCGVDISPFIDNLPHGKDTRRFTSDDASGSTSQAAAIIEALEMDATALLIDEDTSATNFMIRDRRMQMLVAKEKEPITPFVDRVRALFEDHAVSTVLVIGGSGDYLDVADTVIVMDEYQPRDVTGHAKAIAKAHPTQRDREGQGGFARPSPRAPLRRGFDPSRGKHRAKVRARRTQEIQFGREEINIAGIAQLIDAAQTRCVGDAMVYALDHLINDEASLLSIVEGLEARLIEEGPEGVGAGSFGDRASVRRFEIAACINRLRTLAVG